MSDTPNDQDQSGNILNGQDANAWHSEVPEKYRVNGEPDFQKLTKGYNELAKMMGSRPSAPESFDKYTLPTIEGVELKDEQFKGFKEWAHKNQLSQSQFDATVNELVDLQIGIHESYNWTPAKAEVELRKSWSDPKAYDKNLSLAQRFTKAYLKEGEYQSLRSNPEFIQIAAMIGAELGESGRVNHASILPQEDVEKLLGSEAYADPTHPEHATVHAKVQAHYQNAQKRKSA